MDSKQARNQIYTWVKAHGIKLDKPAQTELKKLIIQYGETLTKVAPKERIEKKEKIKEWHTPKTFG